MNFEEMMNYLQEIVTKMEDKNTTLDESLELFNQGVKASTECIKILDESKGKVEQLIKQLNGLSATELEVK